MDNGIVLLEGQFILIYKMVFKTPLTVTQEEAWQWITSFKHINKEVMPLLYMLPTKGFTELKHSDVCLGKEYCGLSFRLFGMIPVAGSKLVFNRFQLGTGFTESSTMTGMKQWQHDRTLLIEGDRCVLVDSLTFAPVVLPKFVAQCIAILFRHRHKKLRQFIG